MSPIQFVGCRAEGLEKSVVNHHRNGNRAAVGFAQVSRQVSNFIMKEENMPRQPAGRELTDVVKPHAITQPVRPVWVGRVAQLVKKVFIKRGKNRPVLTFGGGVFKNARQLMARGIMRRGIAQDLLA